MGAIQGALNSVIGSTSQAVGEVIGLKEQKKTNEMAAENKKLAAIDAADKFNTAAYEAETEHKANFSNEVAAMTKKSEAKKALANKHPKDEKGKFIRYDKQKLTEALANASKELEAATAQREMSYQRIAALTARRDALMKDNRLDANYLTKQAFDLKTVNNPADAMYEFEKNLGGKK